MLFVLDSLMFNGFIEVNFIFKIKVIWLIFFINGKEILWILNRIVFFKLFKKFWFIILFYVNNVFYVFKYSYRLYMVCFR